MGKKKPTKKKRPYAKVITMNCGKRRGCIVTKLPYCKAA